MAKKQLPKEILLWLAIHGGDPVPGGELSDAHQLLLFQALKDMAAGLSNAALRKDIESLTNRAIADVAQRMGAG